MRLDCCTSMTVVMTGSPLVELARGSMRRMWASGAASAGAARKLASKLKQHSANGSQGGVARRSARWGYDLNSDIARCCNLMDDFHGCAEQTESHRVPVLQGPVLIGL